MNYRPHYLKLHLEETPAQIFSCVFGGIFKNVPLMIAPADSSILTKFLSTDHTFLFLYFLSIIASMVVTALISSKKLKDINCLQPTWICKHQIWNYNFGKGALKIFQKVGKGARKGGYRVFLTGKDGGSNPLHQPKTFWSCLEKSLLTKFLFPPHLKLISTPPNKHFQVITQ